jgi:leucyl aminopeptidase
MQFSHSPNSVQTWTGGVMAVGLCEGEIDTVVHELEGRFELAITPWLEQRGFTGKEGDLACLELLKPGLSSLVLVGLGKA